MTIKWFSWVILIGLLAACQPDVLGINVNFDRWSGLTEGDRVLFEKNEAGRVRTIEYKSDGKHSVGLDVRRDFSHALTDHSLFYVIDDPLRSGSKAVDIRISRKGGVPLKDGATVDGVPPAGEMASQWREGLESALQQMERRLQEYGRNLEELPESDAYRHLKQTLREWAAEMEQTGKDAREEFEHRWLPRVRRQLEDLKKWLRDHGGRQERAPSQSPGGSIRNV